MRKIPTLFVRDFSSDNGRYVTEEVDPGCEWVLAGEGVATRKYDGTCVMFDGTAWWARREVKRGKTAPAGFRPEQEDETTGKTVGWEPIEQSPFAKFHDEAVRNIPEYASVPVGTYELIGPKINGNPERRERHELERHDTAQRLVMPTHLDYEFVRLKVQEYAEKYGCEGIVWHHPDGRMAKIKARDFRSVEEGSSQP